MTMTIQRRVLDEIRAHAEATYPEECCGLLIADGGNKVVESVRMKNAFSGSKGDRYHIDPMALYKVDRESAQRRLTITGIYHSHPDYPAVLSEFDIEHSFPWYSYLVVSVPKGHAGDIRAWFPDENRNVASEEGIEVTEE